MKRVAALQDLARDMVGDSLLPNVFFVSVEGVIELVTTDALTAYKAWRALPRSIETALEDRATGVICDTSPHSDVKGAPLLTVDCFAGFFKAEWKRFVEGA